MKIITFNANGIRAAKRKNFFAWLETQNADFVCLQEIKADVLDESFYLKNYFCEYFSAEKKGYSGVGIYAKSKPDLITKGMGFCDSEGRYLQYEYENLIVVSLYLPSGTSGASRQAIKITFLDKFYTHLLELKKTQKHLIICGDFNIAHKKIDLKNWQANQKNSGFLPEERAWMDMVLDELGFCDAQRIVNPEAACFTWWTYRAAHAFAKDIGWRIDYQIISPSLKDKVVAASVYKDVRMSDHAPLIINYGEV